MLTPPTNFEHSLAHGKHPGSEELGDYGHFPLTPKKEIWFHGNKLNMHVEQSTWMNVY
jgi:hypothetical protein